MAAGQTLNVKVYQLLGHDGVYYGARFGRRIPWVSAWPYSHVRDPQYIGCILTLLGLGLTLLPAKVQQGLWRAYLWPARTRHLSSTPSLRAKQLTAFWIVVYFYNIWLEGSTPGPDAPDSDFATKTDGSRPGGSRR